MADNERDELLRRFINVVGDPAGSTFFDEDELVEIFDYAGDLGDDFLRIEALLWGARLFPESVALAERRATLYYDFGNDKALEKVMKNVPSDSVLRRLLMLRSSHADESEARSILEGIVEEVRDFKDEEIIQFVQTAGESGLYQWLKESRKDIVARCSFPQAFLYELIPYAEENGDYEYIVELLDELTTLEPFNSEFWEMLADYYDVHFSDPEKTLNATEYALAINPDSVKAAVLKASSMYHLQYPPAQVEKLLKETIEAHPDESAPVHLLADIYASSDRLDDALILLEDFLKSHPDDRITLSYLISGSQGNLDNSYLEKYYDAEHPDTEKLLEWARAALQQSRPIVAVKILRLLDGDVYAKEEEAYSILITALYANRDYEEVRTQFLKYKNLCETTRMLFNMNMAVLYALSSFAWADTPEKKVEVLNVIEWVEEGAEKCAPESPCVSAQEAISRFGVMAYLCKVREMILSDENYHPDSVNPFLKGVGGIKI